MTIYTLPLSRRAVLQSAVALQVLTSTAPKAQIAPRRVLWAANVRTKPVIERLAAAKAGRFTQSPI